jgi:murein lipoprotein
MGMIKLTMARRLGIAIVAALSLGACATRDDIAQINSRLDSIDSRVQSAAQSAESANQNSQRANQRLDSLEGRIQQLETQPARRARG